MKIEIVIFRDGLYGVRSKTWFNTYYYSADLYKYEKPKYIGEYCHLSLEIAHIVYDLLTDEGIPVRE